MGDKSKADIICEAFRSKINYAGRRFLQESDSMPLPVITGISARHQNQRPGEIQ
jgi:hypothetical protein